MCNILFMLWSHCSNMIKVQLVSLNTTPTTEIVGLQYMIIHKITARLIRFTIYLISLKANLWSFFFSNCTKWDFCQYLIIIYFPANTNNIYQAINKTQIYWVLRNMLVTHFLNKVKPRNDTHCFVTVLFF